MNEQIPTQPHREKEVVSCMDLASGMPQEQEQTCSRTAGYAEDAAVVPVSPTACNPPRACLSTYEHLSSFCRSLTDDEGKYEPIFNSFIITCIIVAGVLVGVQTYNVYESHPVIEVIDLSILGVFCFEVVVKVIAEGRAPWKYFVGKEWAWNTFDFLIVVLCLPAVQALMGGNSASVSFLRLLRLARVLKIVKKVPQLQIIVMGLAGGLNSIAYILLLLSLVFYLYSILGIYAFRQNDPWHFKSVGTAFLTLFRAATLEDWTDIMYINIFGCDEFPGGIYELSPTNETLSMYLCENAKARPVIAAAYWTSFIVIAGMVMLSLFVGAVTMSMSESMQNLEEEKQERRKLLLEQRRAELEQLDSSLPSVGSPAGDVSTVLAESDGGDDSASTSTADRKPPYLKYMTSDEIRSIKVRRQMRDLLGQAWGHRPMTDPGLSKTGGRPSLSFSQSLLLLAGAKIKDALVAPDADDGPSFKVPQQAIDDLEIVYPPGLLGSYLRTAERCRTVADDTTFNACITIAIVIAGVLVGIQTDRRISESEDSMRVFDTLDIVILAVFIVEVFIKVVAEGTNPHRYLWNSWNCFDLVVVLGSVVNLAGGVDGGSGGLITMLRLLRLLRILKLVKRFPQLAIIVDALIMGLSSIGFIGIILILVYYVFAIIGIILFRGTDPWHFGSLQTAMLTLFRVSTLEDWTDIMYTNIYGCASYGYDDEMPCDSDTPTKLQAAIAAIYFCCFVVLAALVLLTLFVGVVTTSMDEATTRRANEDRVQEKLDQYTTEADLSPESIKCYVEVFEMLDADHSGFVERDEIRMGLESIGVHPTERELDAWLSGVDGDENDVIDCAEFVKFMCNARDGTNRTHERERQESGAGPGAGEPALSMAEIQDIHSGP